MINLYAKIFIGFWLCMLAIAGSWIVANRYVDSYPDAPQAEQRRPPPGADARMGPGAPPPRQMFRIFYGMQNLGQEQLPGWISEQEQQHGIRIYLVDQEGAEVFGRKLENGTAEVIAELGNFRRRAQLRTEKTRLFAQRLFRPEWGPLTMVVAIPPPASPLLRLLTEHLWLRLLIAVVISGLISYGISRYLTRPLKQLQAASRRLAEGDLDTRIQVPGKGGDETAELARDFNSMAGQLQRRIQEQKQLLHDVSHELRSPLARMRVAIALAEKNPAGSAAQLQRMERETERLDQLIAQLLVVPDQQVPLEDSLDLVALLEEVCEDTRFEASEGDKQIQLSCEDSELIVRTHGDLLKKALENIVRNALHYTVEGSMVTVRLEQHADHCLVAVQDAGPGVPEDQLDRVFDPFYRVDDARARDTGGFGLGLAIARRAVEQHNGSVRAINTAPGLRVEVSLPLAPD